MQLVFEFASPQNKAVTGPLPRFAEMIRTGYPEMLSAKVCHFFPFDEPTDTEAMSAFHVLFELESGQVACYAWVLERQHGAEDYEGCWMTSGVQPNNRMGGHPMTNRGNLVDHARAMDWIGDMQERWKQDCVTV